jgi:hypothetical protein
MTDAAQRFRREVRQPPEITRQLPRPLADDLGHVGLGVIVADPPGHAAEELKRPAVPLRKRLAVLAR